MPQKQTKELILRMKLARLEQGLTQDDVVDRTEKMGTRVSPTSVRRIFAEGSEDKDFRTDTTLMPVAKALLPADEIRAILTVRKDDDESSLRNMIALKEEMIDVLNKQLAQERADRKEQLAEIKQDNKAKVDYLKDRVEYLKTEVAKRRKTSIFLGVGLIAVMVFVIVMLIIDGGSPDIGWLRG